MNLSNEENKVISLIENSKNPALALEVALTLILEFLEPLQVSECKHLEPHEATA